MWTGGLPHRSGLPHIPGVPHLHVNTPLVYIETNPDIFETTYFITRISLSLPQESILVGLINQWHGRIYSLLILPEGMCVYFKMCSSFVAAQKSKRKVRF